MPWVFSLEQLPALVRLTLLRPGSPALLNIAKTQHAKKSRNHSTRGNSYLHSWLPTADFSAAT